MFAEGKEKIISSESKQLKIFLNIKTIKISKIRFSKTEIAQLKQGLRKIDKECL